jgi:ribonuclease HI
MEVMVDRMLCPCGPGGESKFVFTHTGTGTSILGARYRSAAPVARKIEPSVPAIHTADSKSIAAEGSASTLSPSALEQPVITPVPAVAPESPVLPCMPCEREGLRRDACRLHPETGEGVCDDWEQIHPHGETLGELIRAETDALAAAAEPTIEAPDEPAAATPAEADALPWDPAPETTQGTDDQAPAAVTEPQPPQPPQPAAPKLRRGEWHPPLDLIDPVTKEPWIYLQAWTDASASYGQRGSAPEPAGIGVVLVLEGKEHRAISQRIEDGDTYFAELRAIEIAIRQCPDDEPLYVVGDNESSLRVSAGEARPNVYEDVVQRIRKMVEIRLRRGAPTYFRHVKGHSRHYFNHRADYLAHDAVKEFRKGIVRDPALETPPKPKEPRAPRATKVVATVAKPAAPAAAPAGPSPEEVAAATDARVIPSFLPASERRQPRLGLW